MFESGQMVRVIDPDESKFGMTGEVCYTEDGFIGVLFPESFMEYEYRPYQLQLQVVTVKTMSCTKLWKE